MEGGINGRNCHFWDGGDELDGEFGFWGQMNWKLSEMTTKIEKNDGHGSPPQIPSVKLVLPQYLVATS
jgi:hypothetical protein